MYSSAQSQKLAKAELKKAKPNQAITVAWEGLWLRLRVGKAISHGLGYKFCSVLLGGGYYTNIRYLGEFSTFKHYIILYSNLFTCCLKGTKRIDDHIMPFFCYNKILLRGGVLYNYEIS